MSPTKPVEYRGYEIREIDTTTNKYYDRGTYYTKMYTVSKGMVNVMPAACVFHSVHSAKDGIDRLILAKDDAKTFWLLYGQPGLKIEPSKTGKGTQYTSEFTNQRVQRDENKVTLLDGVLELTPNEALALAAALKQAASDALEGKSPTNDYVPTSHLDSNFEPD